MSYIPAIGGTTERTIMPSQYSTNPCSDARRIAIFGKFQSLSFPVHPTFTIVHGNTKAQDNTTPVRDNRSKKQSLFLLRGIQTYILPDHPEVHDFGNLVVVFGV